MERFFFPIVGSIYFFIARVTWHEQHFRRFFNITANGKKKKKNTDNTSERQWWLTEHLPDGPNCFNSSDCFSLTACSTDVTAALSPPQVGLQRGSPAGAGLKKIITCLFSHLSVCWLVCLFLCRIMQKPLSRFPPDLVQGWGLSLRRTHYI